MFASEIVDHMTFEIRFLDKDSFKPTCSHTLPQGETEASRVP